MDVSKASGIRNFVPNPRKEAQEKKTDLQKQLIQLSKHDDSLVKTAQQKSAVTAQKAADVSASSMNADTANSKSAASQNATAQRRFDAFVKESHQPASSPTGIYSVKQGEDGKAKIVTEESDIPKALRKETLEAQATQKTENVDAKHADAEKVDDQGEKDKEDYGTVAEGEFHFECSDPEHKANPSLHNEIECEKVAEAPSVRPATAAEAGVAALR